MTTLLNSQRPPVYCPGCAHERITQALDMAFQKLGLAGHEVAIVSDIGCSGLFDVFFHTHAFHGLHGRALTYATGLKMARPELTVVVTMGDGGLGIGGAHLLSACRRNLDLTLLVLNNFNYGMTGGQCSATTPQEAVVGSGFLNQLEKPLDACTVAASAGAAYAVRASAYDKTLADKMMAAIQFKGFSLLDAWGVCPGRYTKRNKLTPKAIDAALDRLAPMPGPVASNQRPEYGQAYTRMAAETPAPGDPLVIEARHRAPQSGRQEVVILGSAGQRIVTAGELLCMAGLAAGLHATQKNDYPITVLRGHSVSELVLDEQKIGFTGIGQPQVILALADEGVARRKQMLSNLQGRPLILRAAGVTLPAVEAEIVTIDFKAHKLKIQDWALAALVILAGLQRCISRKMLVAAIEARFKGQIEAKALQLVEQVSSIALPEADGAP